MRVTLEDVIEALRQLGGEAQSYQIKNKITKNFGGIPEHYKNRDSFRETIQVIIQEHTPEEKKYWSGNPAIFRKISRGRFRLRDKTLNSSSENLEGQPKRITDRSILDRIELLISTFEESESFQDIFNANNIEDARDKVIGTIVQRRGQKNFREQLLKVYNGRCVITSCNVIQALEASHIIPYFGATTNHIQNGILLRADIHTLFDLRLLTIDEEKYSVIISPKLKDTYYSQYEGRKIYLPNKIGFYPNKEALKKHREESAL